MNMTAEISTLINEFLNAETVRIMIFLIMVGYVIRMIPERFVPNDWIPGVNCFLFGPVLSFIMLGWPGPGEVNAAARWPDICAYAVAYQRGFLIGVFAWMMHGFVLARIEEAIAKLNSTVTSSVVARTTQITKTPGGTEKTQSEQSVETSAPVSRQPDSPT